MALSEILTSEKTIQKKSEIKGRWEYGIDHRVEWELIGER